MESRGTMARHPLAGPSVWEAKDHPVGSWTLDLGERHRAAIIEASRAAPLGGGDRRAHTAGTGIDPDTEAAVRQRLEVGPGFVVLRGFPVDELSEEAIPSALVGFGGRLGAVQPQNRRGDLTTSIGFEGAAEVPRLFKSRAAMDFHTDSTDVVGLLCVRPGASGGESRLVSAGTVYNRILAADPELLDALHQPLPWDQHPEHGGSVHWDRSAPIGLVDGVPRIDYIGWDIRDAQRHPDAPPLSSRQTCAMALLEATCRLPELQVRMTFEAGDLQLINDRVLLHARDAYTDPPTGPGRRLLRLWLGTASPPHPHDAAGSSAAPPSPHSPATRS